jgi:hypothetical protein
LQGGGGVMVYPISAFAQTNLIIELKLAVYLFSKKLGTEHLASRRGGRGYGFSQKNILMKIIIRISYQKAHNFPASCVLCKFLRFIEKKKYIHIYK